MQKFFTVFSIFFTLASANVLNQYLLNSITAGMDPLTRTLMRSSFGADLLDLDMGPANRGSQYGSPMSQLMHQFGGLGGYGPSPQAMGPPYYGSPPPGMMQPSFSSSDMVPSLPSSNAPPSFGPSMPSLPDPSLNSPPTYGPSLPTLPDPTLNTPPTFGPSIPTLPVPSSNTPSSFGPSLPTLPLPSLNDPASLGAPLPPLPSFPKADPRASYITHNIVAPSASNPAKTINPYDGASGQLVGSPSAAIPSMPSLSKSAGSTVGSSGRTANPSSDNFINDFATFHAMEGMDLI